ECVNDTRAGKLRNCMRQPAQARYVAGQMDILQTETRASQDAAGDGQRQAELLLEVGNDAVVRRGGRGEDRQVSWQRLKQSSDAAIIWPKIVPPIGNAMSFVDHEHADFAGDWIKRLIEKGFIGEAFGRNQQSIDFAGKKPGTNILPHFTVLLFGSDAGC